MFPIYHLLCFAYFVVVSFIIIIFVFLYTFLFCVFVCNLFVVLYGITPRGGLWKKYYLFLIVYDVEGVIVSGACTITLQ